MPTRPTSDLIQRRRFLKSMAATAAVALPGGGAAAQDPAQTDLVILHTNDTHSHIDPLSKLYSKNAGLGGAARRARLIRQIREKHPHVLLLDSGDILQGTPYFKPLWGRTRI